MNEMLTYGAVATIEPGGRAALDLVAEGLPFDGSVNGSSGLPGPADLLAGALAACLAKNLERFSHLLGFRYRAARVEVELERQEVPPRIVRATYLVELETDETDQRLDNLHLNLRKYGTITNTLAASAELSGRVVRAPGPLPHGPGQHGAVPSR